MVHARRGDVAREARRCCTRGAEMLHARRGDVAREARRCCTRGAEMLHARRGRPGRFGVTRYARWVNGKWVGYTRQDAKAAPSVCDESRMPAEDRWARDAR